MLGLFLLTTGFLHAQYVKIGEGVFLGTTAGPLVSEAAVSTYYTRFAYIYPSTVLGNMRHGDTLESLEFMRSLGSGLSFNCNLTIWLNNTSRSDFGAGRLFFPGETSGAVRVYDQNPIGEIRGSEGFHRIPFNNRKYVFDTTKGSNLVLLVEYRQTAAQPSRINWYFESGQTVSGYSANQTKSAIGVTLQDSLSTSSEFHPTIIFNYPRFDRDVAVMKLYTLGKLPVPLGNPDSTKALLRNVGKKDITGGKIYTYLRGVNSGRDSTTYSIGRGLETFINMPSLSPSRKGLDTVFAEAADQNSTNNLARSFRLNNENIYSYRDVTQSPAGGGIGFNGTTGDFVSKFNSNAPKNINQVTVAFAIAGRPFRIGIWDNTRSGGRPGRLLYMSDTLSTIGGNYILDLNKPVPVNGSFYVGVRQLGTANVAFGYQEEFPVRPRTFYYASPLADTNWRDFSPDAPFRMLIEPRLQGDTDMVAISADFPRDSIDRLTMDTMAPRGTVGNIGVKDMKDSFDVICEITVFGRRVYREVIRDTMSAGRRRTYTFPKKFYPMDYGEHEVRIIVKKSGDPIADNDTARRKFFVGVKQDVMISSVFDPFPDAVYEFARDTVMPIATIQNAGYDNTVSFVARCQILRGGNVLYNQSRTLNLPRFQSRILTWPTYRCTDTGRLTFLYTTEMIGDRMRSNDTQRVTVYVIKSYDPGIDSIATPALNVFYPPGRPISMRARVFNDGRLQADSILYTVRVTTAYGTQQHRDTMRASMQGGNGFVIALPKSFVPQRKGIYRAVFRVFHPQDRVKGNDSMVRLFYVGFPFDYQGVSIQYPVSSDTLTMGTGPFAPRVRIANNGFFKNSDLVPFICQVWYGTQRVYQDIKSTNLDTGQSLTIDMLRTLNPPNAGRYRVLLYTNYSADLNRRNDSVWSSFTAVIGRDGSVKLIDSPALNTEWPARETRVGIRAVIASNGRQPVGALRTTAELRTAQGTLVGSQQRNDTLQSAIEEKTVQFSGFVLPDSGAYLLEVRTFSTLDQNSLNDTQRIQIKGYRRVDATPVDFEVPKGGLPVINTSGNKPLSVRIAQGGRDTTPLSGKGYFRVIDSSSGLRVYFDSGSFSGLKPASPLLLNSQTDYPFAMAGVYRARFHLAPGTDLFPENDTLQIGFRVVFNATGRISGVVIRLFPNPGSDGFEIQPSAMAERVEVTDATGRVFPVLRMGDRFVPQVSAGTYQVRIYGNGGTTVLPWIKTE